MYRCRDCGEITEGVLVIEKGTPANCGFYGGDFYKEIHCEFCGRDDLEEADWCDRRREYVTGEDCRECEEECEWKV